MVFFDQNNGKPESTNSENNCQGELKQVKESLLRITADFDNYQKRITKEKQNWISTAKIDIFNDLLPIIDDFDRAFSGYQKGQNQEKDKWMEGFEMIYKSFLKFLQKSNVSEINDFDNFNPELHEAIAQIESPSVESGKIIEVVQKGYIFKDSVLRPAKVTVSK